MTIPPQIPWPIYPEQPEILCSLERVSERLGLVFLHLATGAENPKDLSFSDGSTRDENDLSFGFISRA